MLRLCRNFCVPFCAKDLQHVTERGQVAALEHVENSGTAAADQRHAFLVLSDRLLLIATLDIPEHHLRQLVTSLSKDLLCVFEVGQLGTLGAVIKLHVGDDIQRGGHLRLRNLVLNSRLENQFEYLLDVGVGYFVVLTAVADLFQNGLALDFYQLRSLREGDEVVAERTGVTLGVVDAEGKSHRCRHGIGARIHRSRTIND